MRSLTTAILILALVALSTPALADGGFGDLRRADRYGTCGDCLPPQVDAVIMRPVALSAGGTFALAAFLAGAPFVAIADASALGDFYDDTLGGIVRYVFLDPLGTH